MFIPTANFKRWARQLADEVIGTGIEKNPNYTGLSMPDRYFFGYLGELAVVEMLSRENKAFEYQPQTNGQSDDGSDITVFMLKQPIGVDVKTASRHHHRFIMIPESQRHKGNGSTMKWTIATRLWPDAVEICGAIHCKTSMEKRMPDDPGFPKVRIPTLLARLDKLTPIKEWVKALDNHVRRPIKNA